MFKSKLPHMLCAKCKSKVAREAYYCKNCGEVIDDVVAPRSKIEDRRFSSKLVFALERHLIRNLVVGVILILFAATGIKLAINYFHTVNDNGSSKILQLTAETPQNPLTCVGSICHVLIDLKNKTGVVQVLDAVPDMVTSTGTKFGPADPALMGNGQNYCQQKISLKLSPHQVKRYIGVCSAEIPAGSKVTLIELRDSSEQLVVSGPVTAVVP
jgi:hypothetical protein